MYRCDKCGELFHEPVFQRELIDGRFYETYWASPCCEDAYYEVAECPACQVDYVTHGHDYCETCIRDFEMLMEETRTTMGIDIATFDEMLAQYMEGTL